MKKILKLILLFLLIACNSSLQAQVQLGLRGGILSSSANFSETTAGQTIRNRTGLLGSLLLEFRINEGFAVQPEVSLVQRGWKNTSVLTIPFIGTNELIYQEQINYLEIPVLLKGGFAIGNVRLDLLAGPSLAWAINGQRKVTNKFTNGAGQTTEDKSTEDIDFDQDFEKADFGLQGGAMVSIKLGGMRLFADGRYLYGIKDLSKGDNVTVTSKGAVLSVGILF
jgi:hypothetical protein